MPAHINPIHVRPGPPRNGPYRVPDIRGDAQCSQTVLDPAVCAPGDHPITPDRQHRIGITHVPFGGTPLLVTGRARR